MPLCLEGLVTYSMVFHCLLRNHKFLKAKLFVSAKTWAAAFKKYTGGGTYGRSVDIPWFLTLLIINLPGISGAFSQVKLLVVFRGILCARRRSNFQKITLRTHLVSCRTQQAAKRLASSRSMDALQPKSIPVQAGKGYRSVELIATAPQS